MRVVYVSHSAGLSGAERALLRMVEALDRETIEPIVLIPEEGPLREQLEELRITVLVQPTRWWIPATHWSAATFLHQLEGLTERCDSLTRAIETLRPDLIHTNTVVSLEGAVAAARTGRPHVWHSRGLFGSGFPPAYFDEVSFIYGVVDRLADLLVCVSSAVEAEASRHGVRAERAIVPDGFDVGPLLEQPIETREALAGRLGIEPSARILVALGGIQRRKGQKDLVEAAALLAPEFPDLVVVLAGHASDPDYAGELEDFVRRRGLERVVRFVGFQEQVHSLLVHAEAFVQPSLSEGFALAVLESMAIGTPVVATRSGGPEEILEDGRSGLLVEPGAPAELAEAIRRLLSQPELAARLREEGRRRSARFSPRASAESLTGLYWSLLSRDGRLPPDRRETADRACSAVLARARLAAGSQTT